MIYDRVVRIGGSSNGRTSGFGPEYRGSSPCTPANVLKRKSPSSSLWAHAAFFLFCFSSRARSRSICSRISLSSSSDGP